MNLTMSVLEIYLRFISNKIKKKIIKVFYHSTQIQKIKELKLSGSIKAKYSAQNKKKDFSNVINENLN